MTELFTWLGILLCLSQSAVFSGLNLALFSMSKLQLETHVRKGSQAAVKILRLRSDANLLLCTILWGNVSVNVLLTILADSVLAGLVGFAFSTFGITFFGEIIPQAFFSRHALRAGSLLSPVIRFYRILLYPLAKPSAMVLDRWVGPEGTHFFKEADIEVILDQHIREPSSDISYSEGRGALNFLRLDDLRISSEGSTLDSASVIPLPLDEHGNGYLPETETEESEKLDRKIRKTQPKWIIFTVNGEPHSALNADNYLRREYSTGKTPSLEEFCQTPIVVRDPNTSLDSILHELVVEPDRVDDRVLDREVVLYWGERTKRIITGADLLGRLLHGIVARR